MRNFLMFLVGVVCVVASACGGKAGAEFGMKDQTQIRERADAFVKAFNDKDVLKGRQPDVPLKPGDTIVVP